MPNKTQELGLNLALNTDDCADYEVTYLADSLTTIDGLFNQGNGHTHSGAHQGGLIGSSAFGSAMDLPDWFRSTGQRSAFASAGAGIEMFYDGTNGVLQGYDRGGSAYRPLVIDGLTLALEVGGVAALLLDGSHNLSWYDTTGARFFGLGPLAGHGFQFFNAALSAATFSVSDVGNATIPGSLTLGGVLNVSGQANFNALQVNGVTTLSTLAVNSTLNVTGNTTLGAAQVNSSLGVTGPTNLSSTACTTLAATGAITAQNGLGVPTVASGSQEHIEHGFPSCNGVGAGAAGTYAQTFTRAYASPPVIVCSVGVPTSGDIEQWHVAAQNITTTGFNIRVYNTSPGGGNCTVAWHAIGA